MRRGSGQAIDECRVCTSVHRNVNKKERKVETKEHLSRVIDRSVWKSDFHHPTPSAGIETVETNAYVTREREREREERERETERRNVRRKEVPKIGRYSLLYSNVEPCTCPCDPVTPTRAGK